MLIRLSISGFALIDSLDFEPGEGLNVISGETGAGKSLLIDAIGALIGNRIGKESVRTGNERATVEGVFDRVSSVVSTGELNEFGISSDEDDLLYVSREIHIAGRNVVRINGTLVPLFVLKSIGPKLLDIHGQHEQQAIFQVSKHIELLDRYAGEKMSMAVSEYSKILDKYKECLDEIKRLGTDPQARERRADLLRYQIAELEEAELTLGEEEALFEKKRNAVGISKARAYIADLCDIFLSDDPNAPIPRMKEAEGFLSQLSLVRPTCLPMTERLRNVMLELESLAQDVDLLNRDMEGTEDSLPNIEKRLDTLYRFKSKYGSGVEDMILYLNQAKDELLELESSDGRLKDLHSNRIMLEKELLGKAMKVREIRSEAASDLSEEIVRELTELGMPGAVFGVSISERPKNRFFSRYGCDEVAFVFTANRGEPEKPLEKIASGGEASRIMLAIKTILAQADDTPSLVFDEIDSGVSGKTSSAVASRMKKLARYKQVLCVSHMAQIAAAADRSYFISKEVREERTQTVLTRLDTEGKKREVARLLSGEADAESMNLSEHLISKQDKA
ncbi:MAG: DNA repair protein RecN [Clostridiaceae bacterium]|jgi:DNA repair protein RecN (Recombination protein N)|nr:DNA repair protein RecN [Clostridiaceae bacterium]